MKRTIILAIIFLILAGSTTWYMTSKKDDGKRSYKKTAEMDFAVESESVYKIFINDREGNKSLLTRKDDHWLIDNTYKVRPTAISMLLHTMSRLEVKYRPSKEAAKNIINDFATFGIEVEAYDKNDQLIKNYYVGKGDQRGTGTYMIMAEADEPFAMHIPSFEGSLRPRYFLKGEEWRDKSVFSEKIEEIQSVSVEYPKQKNKSFKLSKTGGSYKVEPFYESTPAIATPFQKGTPEKYLAGFESMVAEAFQNDHAKRDSISALIPFCNIILTKSDGEVKSVKFFPFVKLDKWGNPVPETGGQPVFRLNADCSWGDFMLIQQSVFSKAFWSYDSFFSKS